MEKLLRQRRRTGHIAPLGHRGGAPRRLDEPAIAVVRAALHAQPDMALEELRLRVSVSSQWRLINTLNLPRKKRRSWREADEDKRRAFRETMAGVDTGTRRLIFLDETGCNLNLVRRYGRAPREVRLVDRTVPRNTPPNRSLVGAMSREGLLTSI